MEKFTKGDIVIVDGKSIGEITKCFPDSGFPDMQFMNVHILEKGNFLCSINSLKKINLDKLCAYAVTLEE